MSFQDLEAGFARPHPNNYLNSSQQKLRQEIGDTSPSQSVATGIFKLRTALLAFDRLVNSLATPKDTFELRDKLYVLYFDSFSFLFGKFKLSCIF